MAVMVLVSMRVCCVSTSDLHSMSTPTPPCSADAVRSSPGRMTACLLASSPPRNHDIYPRESYTRFVHLRCASLYEMFAQLHVPRSALIPVARSQRSRR